MKIATKPKPSAKPTPQSRLNDRTSLATHLDRLADHNLHLGFHLAAERLSRQAAELRGVA